MGTTGFTAQAYGAGDRAELRACLLRPLALALGFGCLLILLQGPIRLVALWAIDASAEVAGHTGVYFDIRIWSAPAALVRSEEHTSELQSLMRNSYAVFCLKK